MMKKLRIRKYYRFGRFPFYSIEQNVEKSHWHRILNLLNDDLKMAQSIKKHLLENSKLLK